jgi:HPt (histidine-containing phosphotransfer) domain-containing protein
MDQNNKKTGRIIHSNAPPIHGVRPAVDKTFESAVQVYGKNIVSVTMSGMGNDAGEGAVAIKQAGGINLVCDEKDCLVYGMARSVISKNAADKILPLNKLAEEIKKRCSAWRLKMSEFEAYRGLFVAESRENHENLVKNLLILEKGHDQNAIDEFFRSCHTLKGASASMGFAEMERLCHAMEDVFQLVRSGSAEITRDLGDLLLACADLLEQMIDDVEEGGDSSSKNAEEQVNGLKAWLAERGGGSKPPAAAAPAISVSAAEPSSATTNVAGAQSAAARQRSAI